jgi:ribonuclease HII
MNRDIGRVSVQQRVVGLDEAGRGPLAGPVFAAAVILDPKQPIAGLADSKKLTEKRRDALYELICQRAYAYGIAQASVEEIDQLNILQASLLAMQRAYHKLGVVADLALVDGRDCPRLLCQTQAVVRGDESEPCISAASILAKVTRDRLLCALDKQYPQYGFAKHKGYPTVAHRAAVLSYGLSPVHRRSFRIKELSV